MIKLWATDRRSTFLQNKTKATLNYFGEISTNSIDLSEKVSETAIITQNIPNKKFDISFFNFDCL